MVRKQIIDFLASGPKRYSDIVRTLKRPDKTIWQWLGRLQEEGLVSKNAQGLYELTGRAKTELSSIEAERLPKAEEILRRALQAKSTLDVRTLTLAYVILRYSEKACRGQRNVKLKASQIEAAKQLDAVKKELDSQEPGWLQKYFGPVGHVESIRDLTLDSTIEKSPDGMPHSILFATLAHDLETPLRLLENDLPKDAARTLLAKARKLASDVYEEIMKEVFEEYLASP